MTASGRKSAAARRRTASGQQQLFHNWSLDYLQQAPISKFLGWPKKFDCDWSLSELRIYSFL